MKQRIKTKILNNYYEHFKAQNANCYLEATDSSGNKIGHGDYLLYCPGTKHRDSYITKVLLETIDNSQEQVLCLKLKNGQYRTLKSIECYLVTPDFVALHSKRVFAQ